MSTPQWIPAPRRGIVPLHPLDFGMILGRSFAMLRHNPAVLLGFAVGIQLIISVITVAFVVLVFAGSMERIESLSPTSPDYDAIMAGTLGLSLGGGLLLGLFSLAVGSAVQGVVAANLRAAALGERPRLSEVWKQVKPVFWRIVWYTLLIGVAVGIVILAIVAIAVGLAFALGAALDTAGIVIGIVLGILLLLGFVVAAVWVGTKILLVPTVLVIEHCTIKAALRRSWGLVRGRFWVAFGATALIGLIIGVAANAVSGVTQLLAMMVIPVLMPTGDPFESNSVSPSSVVVFLLILLLPQLLTLVISAVGSIAQNTTAGLVYLDARMRKEGLDQSLIWHTEHRAVGWTAEQLGDPYAVPQYQAPQYQTPQYWAPHPQDAPPQTAPHASPNQDTVSDDPSRFS